MNVLYKFFWSFRISRPTVFSCFLLAGVVSIFFYGIWESIDLWKVFVAVFFFGYGSISLAVQMSRKLSLERALCRERKQSCAGEFILKNVLLSISFWSVLSVSGAFLFAQYKLYVSDIVLFIQVSVLLAFSEILSIFGIAPHDPRY